ncbi:fungal specific transcription factor domain-containing protein [Aspergillus aculeatinus CBS 121060]|uniref:Uncharacterized protein n=1 Tax=Aspergillus aculeatinus CBS 121060 TaxID=1448322 RepID=A0ACD1GV59_9EURO|nr:hypothetical protein BO66DRAFT_462453 [Aspergillus aculeatinus CBS 121060]RAH65340.1 hypothetical protein BO66DRAFT_462453 [Aspergillus aculeatinus CBS 121060]
MSATTELFMRTSNLLTVQTIIGLALFFQDPPDSQPLFIFTAAAIRFAQSIGLHMSNSFGLSDLQVEEQQRVIWLAFLMDANVRTRMGHPAAQIIHNFDTPLSASRPLGIIEYQGERVPLFSILAQCPLIQRRAYDLLFTKEALEKPVSERAHAARAYLEEINCLKDSIDHSLRPQRRFSPEQHHPFLPQIMRLHFACLPYLRWADCAGLSQLVSHLMEYLMRLSQSTNPRGEIFRQRTSSPRGTLLVTPRTGKRYLNEILQVRMPASLLYSPICPTVNSKLW